MQSMQPYVECIPNFSEGRRPEVIQQIMEAITAVDGVVLLDYSLDADHHRSVVTFMAPPETVAEAAYQGVRKAAALIDLRQHQGVHPRIGAMDVCPFVPIQAVSLTDCVTIARRFGKQVGEELHIPVYLYEAAATRPERQNLANVRRGQYEGLRDHIATDPSRAPDFGPSSVGSAGAVAVGARKPLIAFNVYLTTSDVRIAKKIAKVVRHSSGGLRFVKALGLKVQGKAQVSLNLTDFTQTSLPLTIELIRREAQRYGTAIESTELIGLMPQQALFDAAAWYLQLDNFTVNSVLENRLAAAANRNQIARPETLTGG